MAAACSVSINTSSTPTPTAKPRAAPTPAALPVSVVITSQLDGGRCETSAGVTMLVDGKDIGTMRVASQVIPTDRLTVMLTPGVHRYTLEGSAVVQSNGQVFSLKASGQGEVQVNPGTNSWTLAVDSTRLAPGVCPSGGTWPLVLQP